ncbi:MAG: tetratricopeptide repeat protein [Myxococcaceae bacterium]|nr:tetratricopeptide repeat protein [Myxococcaceae bacterium]
MLLTVALWVTLGSDPLVRRGAALFDTLDFEGALASYERALTVRLGSSDELVEALLGVGLCEATLGNDARAKLAFSRALAVKPDVQLEGADISPRQRAPFDAARAEAKGRPAVRIEHTPPRTFPPGAPVTLSAEVVNDWQGLVTGARLVFRREGQGAWEEVAVTGPGPFSPMLPVLGGGAVEYYVQAVGPGGSPVSSWRSAEDPMRVRVAEPADDGAPLYQRPWLWVVVGGVVAAGVVSAVVVTQTATPDYTVRTRPAQ